MFNVMVLFCNEFIVTALIHPYLKNKEIVYSAISHLLR